MVSVFGEDVRAMQKMFIEGKEAPPIAHNLPPIAGALDVVPRVARAHKNAHGKDSQARLKCDGVARRRATSLKTTRPSRANSATTSGEQIEAWGAEMESSSQAKLKNPLLLRGSRCGVRLSSAYM